MDDERHSCYTPVCISKKETIKVTQETQQRNSNVISMNNKEVKTEETFYSRFQESLTNDQTDFSRCDCHFGINDCRDWEPI